MLVVATRSINVMFRISVVLLFVLFTSCMIIDGVSAWSNGGYSEDHSNPDYGTHDWIAQHALEWLPSSEKQYLVDNLAVYLYGTELPDNGGASDGIGDTTKHHIYYYSSENVQDESAAERAEVEYNNAQNYLKSGDLENAAKNAGIMSHYIVDVAVFGHVMGSGTDWGSESHHSDYEEYVDSRTNSYNDEFNAYLSFDGVLDTVSAYDASMLLAYDTTFDVDGDLTCVWMDQHYDWSNQAFRDRCGESLNLAVNYLADVLHSLYAELIPSPTEVSCYASHSSITIGDSVTVYGSITPPLSGVSITISYRIDGPWSTLATISSAADGSYSHSWTPTTVGSYQLKASWEGDENYSGSTSDIFFGGVEMRMTSISCSASPSEFMEGDTVTVTGSLSPALSGKTVTLNFERPDDSTLTRTATTDPDGSYSDSFKPDGIGSWSVYASWTSDSTHLGASSSPESFTVEKKSGCLIATATYGSELSPEVMFLRRFRDNIVVNTFAGRSFMMVFNEFYYSFSPSIASIISSNQALRGATKTLLYPLIGILHISSTAYTVFGFNPEVGIVIAGFIASSLIALTYLLLPILAISYFAKRQQHNMVTRVLGFTWVFSVLLIILGEITLYLPLMMLSTGAFVIVTICGIVTFATNKLYK